MCACFFARHMNLSFWFYLSCAFEIGHGYTGKVFLWRQNRFTWEKEIFSNWIKSFCWNACLSCSLFKFYCFVFHLNQEKFLNSLYLFFHHGFSLKIEYILKSFLYHAASTKFIFIQKSRRDIRTQRTLPGTRTGFQKRTKFPRQGS